MLFGYLVTLIVSISFVSLMASIAIGRKDLAAALRPCINRYSVLLLALIVSFFILFSVLFVSPVERLYFDENIYQGIALNIMHSGNALWCQYGTANLAYCGYGQVYHDPVGWSLFIGIAFALFGAGTATAYGLQLFVGLMSIIGVFLLSAVLFKRKEVPVVAAAVFALNPQLFIWSRTQAVIDLPFMMLTLFTLFFFAVFSRRETTATLAMGTFSLVLTLYTRIEAFLLVPIAIVMYFALGSGGIRRTLGKRLRMLAFGRDRLTLLLLAAVFAALVLPQAGYIYTQFSSGNYGQGTANKLFSIGNLKSNILVNSEFFLGMLGGNYAYYPVMFPFEVTILAAAGMALFAFNGGARNRFAILLVILLWIASYFLFYSFFYAGSVEFGVDSRFMLEILPPLSIAAGLGIVWVVGLAGSACKNLAGRDPNRFFAYGAVVALFILAVAYPFAAFVPYLTLAQQNLPQEGIALNAVNFIYQNYTDVPPNCLVFSFTPDIWYALNRSSAQIGYLGSTDANFTKFAGRYSCYVLDYGYWCSVPPYQNTTCSTAISDYKLEPLVKTNRSIGSGFNFYRILNYTN